MNKEEVYQSFLNDNKGKGTLKVQIYIANQAIPISDVSVIIEKEIAQFTYIIFEGKTNLDGIVDNIILPSPIIEDMDNPSFTTYKLKVSHKSYKIPDTFNIPIYSNQKMIQYVNLIPLYQVNSNE